ncbi:MAG: rod shape-determining protein RodA [Actinobacteria bacterium]|nr:rod shape-determining protein RodA [Actinomycetota bacterium]MCL6105673.1 rod shape-determining protein RodA [Actinomycetota bacterium]
MAQGVLEKSLARKSKPSPSRASATSSTRSNRPKHVLLKIDFILAVATCLLALFGMLIVYSATKIQLEIAGIDPHYYVIRQAVYAIIGFAAMLFMAWFDYKWLDVLAPIVWIGELVFLLAVLSPLGSSALGSQRWFQVGPLQMQPSAFGALAAMLILASYISRQEKIKHREGLDFRQIVVCLAIIGLMATLVAVQPDLGSAILIGIVGITMIIMGGARLRHILLLGVTGVGLVAVLLSVGFLKPYQMQRLTGFLHQSSTNTPATYTLSQSKIAIGSGGLTGTGLFKGSQTDLSYVPEQQTDFIFTAAGEQMGFIGGLVLLFLFSIILWRVLLAATRAKDALGRLICAGVFVLIAFSVFENIGMTIGIMPISGIPLPFVSYGGSALLGFFIGVGMVLNISAENRR